MALLRGRLDLNERVEPGEELAMTAVSLGELTHGAWKSLDREQSVARLDVLLAGLTVLPFDARAARIFGPLRGDLETAGRRLDDLDLQIASIALAQRAPLVTHNRRHFARIPHLEIEDWLG